MSETQSLPRLSFEEWMSVVDTILRGTFGVTHMDISDFMWHDNYSDGATPADATYDALEYDAEGLFNIAELADQEQFAKLQAAAVDKIMAARNAAPTTES